jgi:hypothetical protein
MTSTQRLAGRIGVALPPDEAFRLFTPAANSTGRTDGIPASRPQPPTTASREPSSKPAPTASTRSGW